MSSAKKEFYTCLDQCKVDSNIMYTICVGLNLIILTLDLLQELISSYALIQLF